MKLATLFVALGAVLAPTCGYAQDTPLPDEPAESEIYVVDFYDGSEAEGNELLAGFADDGKLEIVSVLDSLGDAIIKCRESVVVELRGYPSVKVIEEDGEMDILGWVDETQPEELLRGRGRSLAEDTPYGITMVKAADLPNLPTDKSWKKVCVVDTGYENSHPDLPTLPTGDGMSPYGSSQLWNVDGQGHGTHCAGTIGAIGDNNAGVNSVMNTDGSGFENFFIGKGLTNRGSGSWAGVLAAMNACETNGASVISLSLGSSYRWTTMADATKTLHEKGVLLVAAAGNGRSSRFSYPASFNHVMSVAAVDSNRRRAYFSQYNSQVEISGPGVSVRSTYKGGIYRNLSGTSMSTPHVAGVAGLVWSHFPDCSPMQIRYALSRTAANGSGQNSCNTMFGHGIVDAKAAYDFLSTYPCSSNSWPSDFDDDEYVQYGCYAKDDAPWPTQAPAPAPSNPPPTSPSTCQDWCSQIPEGDIPWESGSGLSKCGTVSSFCGACDEC